MDKNKLIKPLFLIAAIIVFCTVIIRVFSGSETLTEYAAKNPDIALTPPSPMADKETQDAVSPPTAASSSSAPLEQQNQTTQQGATAQQSTTKQPDQTAQQDTTKQPDQTAQQDTTEHDTGMNKANNIKNKNAESETSPMSINPERTIYKEGFYYEPLSEELIKRITGVSYPVTEGKKDSTAIEAVNIVKDSDAILVDYDDLRYVSVLYYNFKGIERTGELICSKDIAQDLVEIFYELHRSEYQIEQIHLIDEYSGDDTLSMQDNNTSCFNYRVVDGTSSLSKHALGLAIDINPFFNPYVVYKNDGTTYISPQGSETYADRSKAFSYKIDENDLCYKLFKEHGFTWGGDWNSCKDYQHFQKVPD